MGMQSGHFVVYAGVQINKQNHDEDQDNQIWFIFLSEDVVFTPSQSGAVKNCGKTDQIVNINGC